MAKNKKRRLDPYILILIGIVFAYFVPLILFPEIITNKDNDLGRTYLPIFSFLRDSFYQNYSLPLWRPDQLLGESFIGNGLAPLVYPLNIIFLIFPIKISLIIFYFTHFLIAILSTYYLAKSFSYTKIASLSSAIFYTFSIKMLMHMSAGHITMLAAFALFPLGFLALRKLLLTHKYKWIILTSLSYSGMLILYPTIFYYSSIFAVIYLIYYYLSHIKKYKISLIKNLFITYTLIIAIVLGLSAIQLIPQLEFSTFSSRGYLKVEDAALPLWNFKRFVTSLVIPYINFNDYDHESLLYLGFIPSVLTILGLRYMSKLKRIVLLSFAFLSLLFVAGLSTPIFPLAFKYIPYLDLSRISTRPWYVISLIVALISGYAITKIKNKIIVSSLIILFLIETFAINFIVNNNINQLDYSNRDLYKFLGSDTQLNRTYCTTQCFNPQLIQKYNIQVLHGETPISDKDTIKFLQKAGNYNYNKFAVIFPPYQVWQVKEPPIPNATLLGKANVKYVASTYELFSANLRFVDNFKNIYIYENLNNKPRFYFENSDESIIIKKYTPNEILLGFSASSNSRLLIMSEKYYPGWFAYMNNQKYELQKHDSLFRSILVLPNTNSIRISYNPANFKLGRTITFLTLIIITIYYFRFQRKLI